MTLQGENHWRTLSSEFISMWSHPHDVDFPAEEELIAIKAPILLVHGDRDDSIPVERADKLRHLLGNAELCVTPTRATTRRVSAPTSSMRWPWISCVGTIVRCRMPSLTNLG